MSSTQTMDPISLGGILHRAASSSHGLVIYGDQEDKCSHIPYHELLKTAHARAKWLLSLPGARSGTVVLLLFSTFQENVEWFWASVSAGLLPAVSTPLPQDNDRLRDHLIHIRDVLKQPIVLISRNLATRFRVLDNIDFKVVEEADSIDPAKDWALVNHVPCKTGPAAVILTSGSSGNAKAVVLRHEQIIASARGKSQHFHTNNRDVFLNWIGFDHVASLVETHIHAMYLGARFVHVPAPTLLVDPVRFLRLIDQYRVTYTFAPHFFLARLLHTLHDANTPQTSLDLSCLRHMISGGELNVVDTVVGLTIALQCHNLKDEVVRPGFGMTETCAGSIYGLSCPSYDLRKENGFASLGTPIPGMLLRIVDAAGENLGPGEVGDLQVAGEQVFREYFNNVNATKSSFTKDGWFMTGDRAYVDTSGCLNIAGREKESINLNGIKYFPNEIESALDQSNISGLTPSWNVVFSHRPQKSLGEEICVAYLPTFDMEQVRKRVETAKDIRFLVASMTLAQPKHIIPLPQNYLPKSALGKLPRAKIKAAFEEGRYERYEDEKDLTVRQFKAKQRECPESATEHSIMGALHALVDIPKEDFGVNSSIFDFGITSTGLFALKKRIEKDLALSTSISVGLLLTTPTIRGIACKLDSHTEDARDDYNPVVPLQFNSTSSKTPLWLIHPGSGDVLVFVNLARFFSERTVYGLRTRGLNTGLEDTSYFTSIGEIANTYVRSIKEHQPCGPYAIAGYSLGSTVAFEITKLLEATNDEVAFLGLFDSPPHMRELIERLEWIDVLLNVAYFLELISEHYCVNTAEEIRQRSADEALDDVMSSAPRDRLEALEIDKTRLRKLTDITYAFGLAGKKYNPVGSVRHADIFWATPLLSVSQSREEWMAKHLVRWTDFVFETPRFHECEGVHSKMLNPEHVGSFQKILRRAMATRGI